MSASYVCRKTEANLWTVGSLIGHTWYPVVDCDSRQEAMDKCHFLNGGNNADLLAALRQCVEALHNVPEVGKSYDQQHSDTHMQAVLAAKAAIAKAEGRTE